jgi:hypothetical protein
MAVGTGNPREVAEAALAHVNANRTARPHICAPNAPPQGKPLCACFFVFLGLGMITLAAKRHWGVTS